ncbi:MAG: AAA family ATPase [Betaproteobacteria bacterium]|nr:AAA family ATPase [Betaproteobacteria bacterium]
MTEHALPRLITVLLEAAPYPHPAPNIRLIETHISWVLIAGDFAYKIKKPLDLGFLDFSTLDKRRHFCDEEIRLNRRLAPDIYLDTIAITGSEAAPRIGGDGPALEWAVRMRAFPADATLDRASTITPEQIDAIADVVARFHGSLPPADGEPAAVLAPALDNFRQIRGLSPSAEALTLLDRLETWTQGQGRYLATAFAKRQSDGCIRECHGDLHLGNIAWVAEAPLIFDCIEFNPALRWIDVLSELAFLFMDLVHREHEALAWRLLNRYLEHTGDYAGLSVFRFYLAYRAMVRAKVAAIRARQGDMAAAGEMSDYLRLADSLSRPAQARLLLMHGASGSGKTWLSQQLLERIGAVRLRSDVERKRLFGLDALEDSRRIAGGIYTEAAGARTFQRLRDLAQGLLAAGYTVIVDATFLKQAHRAPFIQLAETLSAPLHILALHADETLLRQRIRARSARGADASEADLAVLDMQLQTIEPFSAAETAYLIPCQAGLAIDWPGLAARLSR